MTKLKDLHREFMKDPAYRKEYDALADEFAQMAAKAKVFSDLGLVNPEQEALRAELTLQIYKTIKRRRLTPAEAGAILGIKRPQVLALMRNRAGDFSADQLFEFLTDLG